MKVTYLGQAGLLFETEGKILMVDPYLSDSVKRKEPQNYRRVAPDERFLKIKPDIIVLTHEHLDHTDPETLAHYITEDSEALVLAPLNAWKKLRSVFNTGKNNFVMFNRRTVWTEGSIKFTAVKAEHSDESAIGVIIEAEGKKYYITGDTLYNEDIFSDLPEKTDYVFLPVNGRGNNMNMADAKRFCERINAKAVPIHCGMFDEIDMNRFSYENKTVPKIYEEIEL